MLIDAFPFFNELDLLDIRLAELSPVVDRFVLVEAPLTHSGHPKPLYYALNKDRYAKYLDKITHLVVSLPEQADSAWVRENAQRQGISYGLIGVPDDAVVLMGDADEIPRASSLPERLDPGAVMVLEQALYFYKLNLRSSKTWHGTRIATAQTVRERGPQWMRTARGHVLPNAGWHFSYLGGMLLVAHKIGAFAHQEYNKAEYTDLTRIGQRMAERRDPYDRQGMTLRQVPIDESYPAYVQEREAYLREWGHIV
jgi:hypothetical protein